MIKAVFVFCVLFMTIGINLPNSMISRIGLDADVLMAALASFVITGLIVHRQLLLILLVLVCAIGANMPEDVVSTWGIDRDYILATLIALVVLPVGIKISSRY